MAKKKKYPVHKKIELENIGRDIAIRISKAYLKWAKVAKKNSHRRAS